MRRGAAEERAEPADAARATKAAARQQAKRQIHKVEYSSKPGTVDRVGGPTVNPFSHAQASRGPLAALLVLGAAGVHRGSAVTASRLMLMLVAALCCNGAQAWTTWELQQKPSGVSSLRGVAFPTATIGYAVGNGGKIVGTTDGGGTWTLQDSGVTESLIGVAFPTATVGYAVGSSGTILGTTDGGTTWTPQNSGLTTSLEGVAFLSATVGHVGGWGGKMLATTDGGTTWTEQTATGKYCFGLAYTTATVGYSVGQGYPANGGTGKIFGTTDGGTTWTEQAGGLTDDLRDVAFPTATVGYAVGDQGVIMGTIDGGGTWTAQTSGVTEDLNGVAFTSATEGYAVGASGTILGTSDGGGTWTEQTSGTTKTLTAVAFPTATEGWVVGRVILHGVAAPTSPPTAGAPSTGAPTAGAPNSTAAVVDDVDTPVGWGVAIYGTMAAATAVSVLASGGLSTSTSSAAKTLGTVAYSKNTPEAAARAGMMTPILFGMPSVDPLYGGQCPNGETDCCSTMTFFGVDDLTVDSNLVWLMILVVSVVVFLAVFVLRAPHYDITRPPLPGHEAPCFTLAAISDYMMCFFLCAVECDIGECCANICANIGECLGFVADVGAEAGDAAVGAVEAATGAGSGAAVEIKIPGMGAPGLAEEAEPPAVEEPAGAPPKPLSAYERLWPLAVYLILVIGYIQFNGLALSLFYVLNLEECRGGWAYTGGWIATIYVLIPFPISIFYVCWVKFPKAVADRQARKDGPPWVKSYNHEHGAYLYYNLETEQSQWECPDEYVERDDEVQARPYEERHGIDCLIADYHGLNTISRFYPLVELADQLLNVMSVSLVFWQYSLNAAVFIALAKYVEAWLTTIGLPLIDESESQRNVENWATAVSLWLMTAGMAVLCFDVAWGEQNAFRQWFFTALSLLAMLVVPVCCWLDKKFPPKQEQPEAEQNAQVVANANPIFGGAADCEPNQPEPEAEDEQPNAEEATDQISQGEGQEILDELREQYEKGEISKADCQRQMNLIELRLFIHGDPTVDD